MMPEFEIEKDNKDEDPAGVLFYEAVPIFTCAAVAEDSYLRSICHQVIWLSTCSNYCNNIYELDLNEFQQVQSIEIGDNSFRLVETFRIDGLQKLTRLKIGNNSFTFVTPEHWRVLFPNEAFLRQLNNTKKSFHILNCEELTSIEIGMFSFSDYAGQFELKNLPALEFIKIGSIDHIDNLSLNFHCSSFYLTGNYWQCSMTLLDLPALKSLYLGGAVFGRSLITKLESLRPFARIIV